MIWPIWSEWRWKAAPRARRLRLRPGPSWIRRWPDSRAGRAERAAVPAVAALRRHFEAVRAQLLADHPGGDPAEATRLLVNRLLHQPSQVLRAMAAAHDMEQVEAERLLRRLFRLDEPDMNERMEVVPVPGPFEG